MVTISTHNGSSVSRGHNIRSSKSVSKDGHIDPNGIHETWVDEAPRKAYARIFGQAQAEYNNKQARHDYKIDDYFNKINADKKKHTVYEMIIGIYGDEVNEIAAKQMMQQFVYGWQQRNPNLELIGAYYHADEQGQPHVHIDYVPVAFGYTRGMSVQNSISKALEQQGFVKQGRTTAQIQWEKRENQVLESICNQYGLEVAHPQKDKGAYHLHTDTFKAQQDLNTIKADINASRGELEALNNKVLKLGSVPIRKVDKHIIGKEKETVTMPKEEYTNLWIMANVVEDLNSTSKRLEEKQKELDEYKNTLEAEKSKFGEIRARFEREKSDAEDNIKNAPEYKQQVQKLEAEKKEMLSINAEQSMKIIELESKVDSLQEDNDLFAMAIEQKDKLNRSLNKKLDNASKELTLMQKIFEPFQRAIELVKKAFALEEVLREPDGELSRKNGKIAKLYPLNEAPEPYAQWSNISNRIQYYWNGSNGDRNGCLKRAYAPLVKEIQKELNTVNMLDIDLLDETEQVLQMENVQSHSRGHSR